jgi:glycosyltransferase 2 family protein
LSTYFDGIRTVMRMKRDEESIVRRDRDVTWFLVSAVVFVLCTLPIDTQRVPGIEVGAFEAVNDLPDPLYWPMWTLMQLGNLFVVPVVVVLALLVRRWRLAAELAVAGIFVWLVAKVVKALFERGRPGELLEDVTLRHAPAAGNGFISGHAAVAAAIAMVLSPYLDKRWRIVVWVLAAMVSVGRVYVGAHLPLDVIGGAAFGIGVGALIHLAMGVPEAKSRDEPADAGAAPAA